MKPHDVRRANLQALIDEKFEGVAGRLADAIGKKRPLVYRIFATTPESRREIGEAFAREIEQKLGLDSGWLDRTTEGGSSQTKKSASIVNSLELPAETRVLVTELAARVRKEDDLRVLLQFALGCERVKDLPESVANPIRSMVLNLRNLIKQSLKKQ